MDNIVNRIENVFRVSSSSEELFDSFQEALQIPITEIQTYKILLANSALSSDEVKMFAEKLVRQFPNHSFETLVWTGKIFENQKDEPQRLEDSLRYYQRAFYENPHNELPLIFLFNLYNYDLETSVNKRIIDFIDSAVVTVNKKSRVYFHLSEHFRRRGDIKQATRYLALGEKSVERESD